MIPQYPSPQQIGHRNIRNLFDGPVVVQEKVDGSQISFGLDAEGNLRVRSRGSEINILAPDKMFSHAVARLTAIKEKLSAGIVYRGEYLGRPKHNANAYDRVPEGYIALFDVSVGGVLQGPEVLRDIAAFLGLDVVPVLYEGVLAGPEALRGMLDRVSFLGGAKIEGVVVKNYALAAAGQEHFAGKFVSESFKEIHGAPTEGLSKKDGRETEERIIASLGTKARWAKAVQHLREAGSLTDSAKDIGPLVKEVQNDILKDCAEEIKEALFQAALPKLRQGFINGLPDWYKNLLLEQSFKEVPEVAHSVQCPE